MRFTFFAFTFLIITTTLTAQKKTDVVYLKNGSIIKGRLIEQSDTLIKIETCCGSIFAYGPEQITEIAQENYKPVKAIKEKGYMNYTSLGVLIGTGRIEKEAPFSIIMEHNYRINKYVSAGIMAGMETLNETVIPVGINGKAMLPLQKGGAVYIGFTGGYSISLEKPPVDNFEVTDAKGGILINPEIGVVAASGSNSSFFMAVGYRYNQLNYERDDYYFSDGVERKHIYNRLSIKIGICFH